MRSARNGGWTEQEDEMLRKIVLENTEIKWAKISNEFNRVFVSSCKSKTQCYKRWQNVIRPSLKKGPWTLEEDAIIVKMVKQHGTGNWTSISKKLPGRIGKRCQERWECHLDPNIDKSPWTDLEKVILKETHEKFGNKWKIIAKYLPGRSCNDIKNHYNVTKKKK